MFFFQHIVMLSDVNVLNLSYRIKSTIRIGKKFKFSLLTDMHY